MSRIRSRRLAPAALALLVAAAVAVAVLWWREGGVDVASGEALPATPTSAGSTSAAPTPAAAPTVADPVGADPRTGGTSVTEASTGAPSTTPSGPAPVAVNVTWSGWDDTTATVLAGGFVGDVVESGGTCTLTLTLGGVVVTGESPAEPDATSTSCGEVVVPGSGLAAGTWEAVLSYSSGRSAGQSAPFTVVVP